MTATLASAESVARAALANLPISGPLEIGFQARYLNDITDQITGDVEFCFADGSAPTVVRDAGDASALYVLMPMRV